MKKLKYILWMLSLTMFLFAACKKKKTDPEPGSDDKTPGKYYFSTQVNNLLIEIRDGADDYEVVDANASSSDGGSGTNISYNFSIQKLSSSTEPYFQLNFNFAHFNDENDVDDIANFFVTGKDTLHKDEPRFDLYYTDGDIDYQLDGDNDTTVIHIDKVTDLGKQTITYPFGGSSSHRVIEIEGRIPAARMYEYSFSEGFGTGYVDIKDMSFVVRYVSKEEME